MTTDNDFFELMTREEPLHPDLQPFVTKSSGFGTSDLNSVPMLHHKWIIELFLDEKHCARINQRYLWLKEEVQKALETQNFHQYVFWHERPYRLDAYLEIEDALLEGSKQQAELFRAIWTDSENIWQHKETWEEFWTSINREAIMTDEEHEAFAKLPDPLTIYRGINNRAAKNGLSWTPDREKAIWFAKRFPGSVKMLLTGKVAKNNVLAYLEDRETEIVVDPENIDEIEETLLK